LHSFRAGDVKIDAASGGRRSDAPFAENHPSMETPRKRPIRVLFLDHTASQSGGEIALGNLVRHLDPEKVTPVVVFGADGPMVEQVRPYAETRVIPLNGIVANAKKDSLGAGSLLRVRAGLIAARYVWTLIRFIRKNDIDVVHTNSLKADLLGGLAGRCSYRLVLWHVRDRIDSDYLPVSVVRGFRFLCRWIPHFVIANSNATLRSLQLKDRLASTAIPSGIELSPRMSIVHDGTPAHFSNGTVGRDGFYRIGLIGRICPWKGQHIVIRAAAIVLQRFSNARFLIVGGALFGEAEYEREVRSLVKELGIEEQVTFAGFRTDVGELIGQMDLVVHASTTGEPFGQVIIEGMAAGKPVIATNGGGVPEIVEDGKTGILVPMADVPAMAEAICGMIADPALGKEMGARGRMRVKDHFSIEQTARNVEKVYVTMISQRA
jgi:glycosyltransferase involved in cell wall biosynthesis